MIHDTIRHIHLTETISTNTYARNESSEEDILLVSTEHQTAGRGQRGNTWESEEGKNLLFSLSCCPGNLLAAQQFALCEYISLVLCEVLDRYTSDIHIKWPNDIYWRDKKICGILIEHDIEGPYIARTIIGIGLNVNQTHFTSNAPNPISLYQILGHQVNKDELLDTICAKTLSLTQELQAQSSRKDTDTLREILHKRYAAQLFRRNMPATYRDAHGIFVATLRDVELDGRLILEDQQGKLRKYLFKEVAYIIDPTSTVQP